MRIYFRFVMVITICMFSCKKGNSPGVPGSYFMNFQVNNDNSANPSGVNTNPTIKLSFSVPVQQAAISSNILFVDNNNVAVPYSFSLQNKDSVVLVKPTGNLKGFTKYTVSVSAKLPSVNNDVLVNPAVINITTGLDSVEKFSAISDSALLTLVQQQTFKYFWDYGHPISGLARERFSSPNTVTTGGSGFGVMAMLVAVQRNFITHAQGLSRVDSIVNFLLTKTTKYHGAFSHWLDGSTGATIPFGTQDDGGDIVETAYMMEGLLCARQFFNSVSDTKEINLRNNINSLYSTVEWNWYRQNNQNALTWNWSPNYGWAINVAVRGWDEALITYVLAASAPVDSNTIPLAVYQNGWAANGAIANGKSFYGIQLPLGPDYGGPLFFAHYSFLGINPNSLTDNYANYWTQNTAHSLINYNYCVTNPLKYYGYSNLCWGLTASDVAGGYTASSPTNDVGVIAPTAAISSLPYSPVQSMNALKFFYYKLGDKIWKDYGFVDAFNLNTAWFDNDFLAIDQGPQIVMIENYRSGLIWNLFMSCPEVKKGMKNLGFTSPNL